MFSPLLYSALSTMWDSTFLWAFILFIVFFMIILRNHFIIGDSEKVIVIEIKKNESEGLVDTRADAEGSPQEAQENDDSQKLPVYILSFLDNMTEPLPPQDLPQINQANSTS